MTGRPELISFAPQVITSPAKVITYSSALITYAREVISWRRKVITFGEKVITHPPKVITYREKVITFSGMYLPYSWTLFRIKNANCPKSRHLTTPVAAEVSIFSQVSLRFRPSRSTGSAWLWSTPLTQKNHGRSAVQRLASGADENKLNPWSVR